MKFYGIQFLSGLYMVGYDMTSTPSNVLIVGQRCAQLGGMKYVIILVCLIQDNCWEDVVWPETLSFGLEPSVNAGETAWITCNGTDGEWQATYSKLLSNFVWVNIITHMESARTSNMAVNYDYTHQEKVLWDTVWCESTISKHHLISLSLMLTDTRVVWDTCQLVRGGLDVSRVKQNKTQKTNKQLGKT